MMKLVIVTPGPVISLNAAHYERMSKEYSGVVITSSPEEKVLSTKSMHSFKLFSVKYHERLKIFTHIKQLLLCIQFAIKARLSGEKYDLVVTYDPLKSGLLGSLVAFITGTKFAPEVNGVYTSPAEYVDGGDSFSTKIKKVIYPIIESIVLRRADGIKVLFPTQVEPFLGVLKKHCIVRSYACFVDTTPFLESSYEEKKEILFAGFPFKRKGVDLLIDAFKQVASKHPDWKLKILGWFPNSDELLSYIDNHPQIYHHPPVYYPEIPEHVGQCAVLVLPSRSEAMGRVLVEAMAAGKPRLGANVDGIPTVIEDGVDGLLFECENENDLAEKLDTLMSDPVLRKKLGDAGRVRAEKDFTSDVFFSNQAKFYHDVYNSP